MLSSDPRLLQIDPLFLRYMIMITLPRNAAMTPFRELPLFTLLFLSDPMIPRLNWHWVILHTILILLQSFLPKANVIPVRHLQDLLLELFIAHQLLNGDQVPPVEKSLLILLNILYIQSLDKCEVVTIDSVLDSRHTDDHFEVPVVGHQYAGF